MDANIDDEMFRSRYGNVYAGDAKWSAIQVTGSDTYARPAGSTYVANPPYFEGMEMTPKPVTDIIEAKPLAIWATRSPPTTSARPVRSRLTARPASSCRSIRSPRRTSTPMARVAVTMR